MPKLLLVQVVRKGWQAVRQALVAAGEALVLVLVLLFSVDPTATVSGPALEAVFDQLLGEKRGAVYMEFVLVAILALIGFFVFSFVGSSSSSGSSVPLRTCFAHWICSRYPGFEAYRVREPESASIMEATLAPLLSIAGTVTLMGRGFIIYVLTNWFGDSSLSPTELPWLVQLIGAILDLAIVLYLMTLLFRRYDLEPTLAEDSVPIMDIDQYIRNADRKSRDLMLAILGISITVPALEVLLSLWLF